MSTAEKPKRWRKAKNPNIGTRWSTPMNNMVWQRDHGEDQELCQGGQVLATVSPDGRWSLEDRPEHGKAEDVDVAKAAALAALKGGA